MSRRRRDRRTRDVINITNQRLRFEPRARRFPSLHHFQTLVSGLRKGVLMSRVIDLGTGRVWALSIHSRPECPIRQFLRKSHSDLHLSLLVSALNGRSLSLIVCDDQCVERFSLLEVALAELVRPRPSGRRGRVCNVKGGVE